MDWMDVQDGSGGMLMVKRRSFCDAFSGAGGLSLGLMQAGWEGRFAVERDPMAFKTFEANLIEGPVEYRFAWPAWLQRKPWAIDSLLRAHLPELKSLRGQIDLLAGGPPCQGFSLAGRRDQLDPRNMLFRKYVSLVEAVEPAALIVENVPGMKFAHSSRSSSRAPRSGKARQPFSERLLIALDELGYHAQGEIFDAAQFGVPQRRPRFVIVGVRKDRSPLRTSIFPRIYEFIDQARVDQLRELGLRLPVTAQQAIGDLEVNGRFQPCTDPESRRGFLEPRYSGPRTNYQRLMHGSLSVDEMNSLRLARHSDRVRERFDRILKECEAGIQRAGFQMDDKSRARFGLLKQRVHPLAKDRPAPTVTTLPDDLLHYSEARILSVREHARLQSFPDWFKFLGKFTTGGDRRVRECPRYTQVGNAVPPLLARALGVAIGRLLDELDERSEATKQRRAG
jgi:DNA (cytosine-5)-methyltransferase 1